MRLREYKEFENAICKAFLAEYISNRCPFTETFFKKIYVVQWMLTIPIFPFFRNNNFSISRVQSLDRSAAGFFVVEALKTVKKPSNFCKKGPQNFFACGGLFGRSILRNLLVSQKGGQKHILLYPPLDNVCPSQ